MILVALPGRAGIYDSSRAGDCDSGVGGILAQFGYCRHLGVKRRCTHGETSIREEKLNLRGEPLGPERMQIRSLGTGPEASGEKARAIGSGAQVTTGRGCGQE